MIHPKWTSSCCHFKMDCPTDLRLQISSDGWSKDLFLILVFFWVGQFGNYFSGGLIYVGIFLGIQSNQRICGSACVFDGMGLFGVKFWSRDFWGFCWKPLVFFFKFDFCPRSVIPVIWNPEYPPGCLTMIIWVGIQLKRTIHLKKSFLKHFFKYKGLKREIELPRISNEHCRGFKRLQTGPLLRLSVKLFILINDFSFLSLVNKEHLCKHSHTVNSRLVDTPQ